MKPAHAKGTNVVVGMSCDLCSIPFVACEGCTGVAFIKSFNYPCGGNTTFAWSGGESGAVVYFRNGYETACLCGVQLGAMLFGRVCGDVPFRTSAVWFGGLNG